MDRKLLLIRHAQSQPQAGISPARWPLTEKGRSDAAALAEAVRPFQPAGIFASQEPKAAETGAIIAGALGLHCAVRAGLQEHMRPAPERLGSRSEFEATVTRLFEQPEQLVFGLETARQALDRFEAAVLKVLDENPAGNLAVVSHGTVISLFVAKHNAVDAVAFWRGLKMPDLIVLDRPNLRLVHQKNCA